MRRKAGICKLTGKNGRFVRSHLLPKALTRPSIRSSHFIQSGHGSPPRIRWDSWYDDELVTREGEDSLTRYDTWAIQELSQLELRKARNGRFRRDENVDLSTRVVMIRNKSDQPDVGTSLFRNCRDSRA